MATPIEIFEWLGSPADQRDTNLNKNATAYLLGIWDEVRNRIHHP